MPTMDEYFSEIDSQHLNVIKDLLRSPPARGAPTGVITPSRIRNHHKLLDPTTDEPLYSLDQISRIVTALTSDDSMSSSSVTSGPPGGDSCDVLRSFAVFHTSAGTPDCVTPALVTDAPCSASGAITHPSPTSRTLDELNALPNPYLMNVLERLTEQLARQALHQQTVTAALTARIEQLPLIDEHRVAQLVTERVEQCMTAHLNTFPKDRLSSITSGPDTEDPYSPPAKPSWRVVSPELSGTLPPPGANIVPKADFSSGHSPNTSIWGTTIPCNPASVVKADKDFATLCAATPAVTSLLTPSFVTRPVQCAYEPASELKFPLGVSGKGITTGTAMLYHTSSYFHTLEHFYHRAAAILQVAYSPDDILRLVSEPILKSWMDHSELRELLAAGEITIHSRFVSFSEFQSKLLLVLFGPKFATAHNRVFETFCRHIVLEEMVSPAKVVQLSLQVFPILEQFCDSYPWLTPAVIGTHFATAVRSLPRYFSHHPVMQLYETRRLASALDADAVTMPMIIQWCRSAVRDATGDREVGIDSQLQALIRRPAYTSLSSTVPGPGSPVPVSPGPGPSRSVPSGSPPNSKYNKYRRSGTASSSSNTTPTSSPSSPNNSPPGVRVPSGPASSTGSRNSSNVTPSPRQSPQGPYCEYCFLHNPTIRTSNGQLLYQTHTTITCHHRQRVPPGPSSMGVHVVGAPHIGQLSGSPSSGIPGASGPIGFVQPNPILSHPGQWVALMQPPIGGSAVFSSGASLQPVSGQVFAPLGPPAQSPPSPASYSGPFSPPGYIPSGFSSNPNPSTPLVPQGVSPPLGN